MFNMNRIIIVFPVIAILMGACTSDNKIANLEKEIASLKGKVDSLEQARSWDDIIKDIDSIAYLTPGLEGYSIVQTDLGRMTVSLEDVQAYANGSRIKLRIGNLTSATVNGANATIEWGSVNDKGTPIYESTKAREVTFTQSLRPGAWTTISVVLTGVPPVQLGFVRIKKFSHSGLVMLK